MWLFTSQNRDALFWARFLMAGAIVIPSSFLHFTLTYLFRKPSQQQQALIRGCYFFSLVYLFINATPLFISHVEPRYWFQWWPIPGILYHPYQVFFIAIVTYTHFLFFRAAHRATGIHRKHLLLVAAGTAIAFSGGSTNFFLWYNIPIPPVFNFLVVGYVVFIFYAVLNYGLWNITVIIKKTLVLAGLFGMVMVVAAVVSGIANGFLGNYFSVPAHVITISSSLLVMLIYDPLRKWLVNTTDRYLFQKKQSVRRVLEQLTEEIITILDLRDVGDKILKTLHETLRTESGVLLLLDDRGESYDVLKSLNVEVPHTSYPESHALVEFLSTHPVINLEEPNTEGPFVQEMKTMRVVIALALKVQGKLIGVLYLGKKKSDQEYDAEEISYFPILAGQIAIALSNARLFELQKKQQAALIQQEKLAMIGTLSSGISHEIKNPLNNIRGMAEMVQMNTEDKIYESTSRQEYEKIVLSATKSIIEDVDRAAEIIHTLMEFMHQSDSSNEIVAQEADLKVCLDKVKVLLDADLRHNQIIMNVRIPENTPKVQADPNRVNEILLNLLNNACQAIHQKGTIDISMRIVQKKIILDIADTGPGIDLAVQEKIFDPFFTTKKQGEGTGLGLHICREMMTRMQGAISVKSEVGKGAVFSLEFLKAA